MFEILFFLLSMEAGVGEGAAEPSVRRDEIAGAFSTKAEALFLLFSWVRWEATGSILNRNEMMWLTLKSPLAELGRGKAAGDLVVTFGEVRSDWFLTHFWKLTQQDWVTDGVWDVRKQFE